VTAPGSVAELAAALAGAAADGRSVRLRGGGTKLAWGRPLPAPDLQLSTAALTAVREHNEGDLTAVVEAGLPLATARERFARAGQMLALDPPLGAPGQEAGATLGGVVATADSGPLRHRYGGARDLVVGITVALSDGTVARSGGKVIKNVAGYDLAKLVAGSFGTLGAIVELSLRLHPLPPATATAIGRGADPEAVAAGALALSHARIELDSLDVRRDADGIAVLARVGGVEPAPTAAEAGALLSAAGLATEVTEDDGALWDAQRAGQRSAGGTVVRVSGLQTQLADVLRAAAKVDATVVGRAALGLSWVRVEGREPAEQAAAVADLRTALAPSPCAVLDAPDAVRTALDPWGAIDAAGLARRIKQRFDPAGVLAEAM
jgi:glycolate oxidase FAD binding subunit